MPSPSPSTGRTSLARRFGEAFPRTDWGLLTRLPRDVVIAATTAQADSPPRTVAEALAGLNAIAAGRSSDSDLVRAVVAEIYAETGDDEPPAPEVADRVAGVGVVLQDCRRAAVVLSVGADPADSAAYRHWVQHIAARVCRQARNGEPPGGVVQERERRFLADLGVALGLR
jgi:hypothetical protein